MALHLVSRWHARYERLIRFFRARFEREEYLGLHLTVGFLASLGWLAGFGFIAHAVVLQRPLTQVDLEVQQVLRQNATLFGYGFWSVVSGLGGGPALLVITLGVGVLLALRRRLLLLGGWLAAIAGGSVLDGALKLAFRRPRPDTAVDFLTGASWSFPSGHAMASLVTYGMLAYVISVEFVERSSARRSAIGACAALVVAIGLSRLYLGVHYFSDVLGGFAAGGLWLTACMSGLEVARRLKKKVVAPPGP